MAGSGREFLRTQLGCCNLFIEEEDGHWRNPKEQKYRGVALLVYGAPSFQLHASRKDGHYSMHYVYVSPKGTSM